MTLAIGKEAASFAHGLQAITMLRGLSIGAGTVFIAIDVGLLVKDFASKNKATKYSHEVEKQIEEQIEVLDSTRKALLAWLPNAKTLQQGIFLDFIVYLKFKDFNKH